MYQHIYGMKINPFQIHPVPTLFFESKIHTAAMRFLLENFRTREPFVLVEGAYGMGKTLLHKRLHALLEKNGRPHICLHPSLATTFRGILLQILEHHGQVPDDVGDLDGLRAALVASFRQSKSAFRRCTLLVDDAQGYGPEALRNLQYLGDLETGSTHPFQIIFFAHPSFSHLLHEEPTLEPLDQRLRRRFTLRPFDFAETKEYIYFRLLKSGASGSPYFPDESIEKIVQASGGLPRFINTICDAALQWAGDHHLDVVEPELIMEVVERPDISIHFLPSRSTPPTSGRGEKSSQAWGGTSSPRMPQQSDSTESPHQNDEPSPPPSPTAAPEPITSPESNTIARSKSNLWWILMALVIGLLLGFLLVRSVPGLSFRLSATNPRGSVGATFHRPAQFTYCSSGATIQRTTLNGLKAPRVGSLRPDSNDFLGRYNTFC